MKRNVTIALVATLTLLWIAWSTMRDGPTLAQGPAPVVRPVNAPAQRALLGMTSCSASVCHGGTDLGNPFSEATTWQSLDPHARAYNTLLTNQSVAMAKQLWGDKTHAHDAPLCLKCHVHPEYDHARPSFRKQDGVSCESCHGAAQDWLTPHYRRDWKNASPLQKEKLGFADTKSLPGRANVCVGCHVGTPDANVDHDLIAAGHPPLRFEFATYLANLPPHWDVAKNKRANVSKNADDLDFFDLQAWIVGQEIAAAAAFELRAYRADPANGKPWPEFAEFDCFACHQGLKSDRWQRERNSWQGRPGSLRWNTWYSSMLSGLTPELPELEPVKSRAENAKQAREYAKTRRDFSKGRAADLELVTRIGSMARRTDEIGEALDERTSWDFRTQLYFALLAARPHIKHERLTERLLDSVTFPPGFNGPRQFEKRK